MRIIRVIRLPADGTCEITDELSVFYIGLQARLWLVHVISLRTAMLVGNGRPIFEFPLRQWLRERA